MRTPNLKSLAAAATLATALLTLAACGGSSGGSGESSGGIAAVQTTTAPTENPAPADTAPANTASGGTGDLCSLISNTDAAALLGDDAGSGEPGETTITETQRCVYETASGARLTLAVSADANLATRDLFEAQMQKIGATDPVDGLGEVAFADESGDGIRIFLYQDAKHAYVTVRGAALPAPEVRTTALELAEQLQTLL